MKNITVILLLLVFFFKLNAQVVINEASNRNYTQVVDEDGNQYDWFELYNPGLADLDIYGWGITDSKDNIRKWVFPHYILMSGKQVLLYASGLNIKKDDLVNHWESAILPADTFFYLETNENFKLSEPIESIEKKWKDIKYDASEWKKGTAGFGFYYENISTITAKTSPVVYIRKVFNIPDTASICDAILHIDYDDGFVAYLNGVEIARNGIEGVPTWNSLASIDHNALMYQGKNPEKFPLDMSLIRSIWQQGENVFAAEVHNRRATSIDLSLIPFLSFGISNKNTFFNAVPDWFKSTNGISLHTNFKIESKGETLYLSNPDGSIVDSLTIPRIPLNSSVGRITDGADSFGIFLTATPGTSNNTSKANTKGSEPMPKFNYQAGFYNSQISVTIIDTTLKCQVRYTTDGSEPTENSTLYSGTPLSVSKTLSLRAKSFSTEGKLPSKTTTATYFISKTHAIPVVSITTNNENLYGASGIFDNWDETWNKPCYVEYFDRNRELKFSQEAGIQIDGGAGGSRSQPQHSVRIEPGNGTFGEGNVKYKLIPDRQNRENYSSFYLRNGSNQYNTLQYKDGLQVKAIAKNTYTYYSAHTAVVAYINGSYSGVYELREKLNADYLKYNYLMDNDSLDLLTLSYFKGLKLEALEGSTTGFYKDFENFKQLSPKSDGYLNKVSEFLDLDNYTDYIIAQSWICNTDWPNNNIRAFRNKSTQYKWRFAVQDVEWAMDPHSWSTSTTDHIEYMFTRSSSIPYIAFWLNLITNTEYKVSFINRFADLMNTNYLFSVIGPMEQEMYDFQFSEMVASFEKWKNSSLDEYTSNHNIFRKQLEIRSENVRNHIISNFGLSNEVEVTFDVKPAGSGQIKISTISPVSYPWNGIYFSDVPVKITAVPNLGYKFSGWNENSLISNINDAEFTATMTNTEEIFTANFEASDETFKGVTISEIHYKNGQNENTSDWVEVYNAGDSEVSLKGWYITDEDSLNVYEFKDNDLIDANSRIIVVRNIKNFNQKYPEINNITGPFDFKLGSLVDAVKLYNSSKNLVAEVNYSDIYPWPLSNDEEGRTLELRNPLKDLNDPFNWYAGCIGGSPGTAFQACPVEAGDKNYKYNEPILSAYPVPAKDYIILKFTLKDSLKNCTLRFYDMYGYEVKTIYMGYYVEAGSFSSYIDLTGLPIGLLFVQMQSDKIRENIKIIHIK